MKKRGLLGVLLMALVLCFALVGCGGAGASAADNFVGTWALESLEENGEPVSEDELAMAQAMGVYLVINEDNTASIELFGVEVAGTWTAQNATAISIKVNDDESAEADSAELGEEQDVTYEDGKLVMAAGDEKMTFKQIDPSEKTSTDLTSLLGDLGDAADGLVSEEGANDDIAAALADTTELDITVADDDICSIRVTALGDYYGDPGYLVTVTNKSDTQINVDDNDEFSVGDAVLSPIFSMIVDPGETRNEILWFSTTDLTDAGLEGLSNVSGKLIVSDYETGDELATYDFTA